MRERRAQMRVIMAFDAPRAMTLPHYSCSDIRRLHI